MRLVLIAVFVVSGAAAGCGKKQADCRSALEHALDVASKELPAGVRETMLRDKEKGIAACEAEKPPQEVLDCTMAAQSMADLKRCDALRTAGGAKPTGDAVRRIREFADKMCACKDQACLDAVQREMNTRKVTPTDAELREITPLIERAGKCAAALSAPAPPPAQEPASAPASAPAP